MILSGVACAATLEDVRIRIRAEYLNQTVGQEAGQYAESLDTNGQWADIDYADRSRAMWQLEKHLDRIIDMALLCVENPGDNSRILDASLRALDHWFAGNYHNDNWWYTKIGMPRRLLSLAYILDPDLTPNLRDSLASALSIIDSDDFPARPGGDRIQVISNHAKVLLWKRDFANATKIIKKIEAEARVAPYEEMMYDAGGGRAVRNSYRPSGRGVQSDMSFHHRGDRVNSTLTYGMELPEFFSYWSALLSDTDLKFSESSIHFVIDYYLDGVCRHLVRGRFHEPSILNRELARPERHEASANLTRRLLAICDGYRAAQLSHYADVQQGLRTDSTSFAAFFPQSDYFTFSRPGFHTAVRMSSYRTANQEAPHNSEGLRNHFRGDGACMLSITGTDYAGIAPCFDFRRVPGTTTPLIPYEPLDDWGPVQILDCPTRFATAVSDSLYGTAAIDFISPRSDLKARKAWFFFNNEYLCLGSGISCSLADSITTTVEQCIASPHGYREEEGGWYFNSGNAYHVINGNPAAAVEHRKGSWRNCVDNVAYADDTTECDVFTLSIEHGAKPAGASYAYAVTPNTNSPLEHTFTILANNYNIQAAASKDGSLVYIVFYAPGSIDTPQGKYSACRPCVMMIRDGIITINEDNI